MKKRTVQKRTQISVDMDEQARPDGSTSQAPHMRRKRKRDDIGNINWTKKNQSKGINTVEQKVKPVDKISELPESIIHHILSFIRSANEAARTSILSKKWRDAWKSFSILKFDERLFKTKLNLDSYKKRQMFIEFIDNSLQSHIEQNLGIYKLVLRISSELAVNLNRWVSVALRNGAKELDLHVEDERIRHYFLLPLMSLAKSLIGLRLRGFNRVSFDHLKLNSLQKLYLRRLYVDQQMIQKLFSACPLIMDLRIVECQGLRILKISSSLKLDRVELHHCRGVRKIELQVANLQTFWYGAMNTLHCKINLESCKSLKRLTLEDPSMTDALLKKRLSSFPVLEKLDLNRCNKLMRIRIENLQLRRLILRSCKNLKLAEIDTPRLCSLDFKGDRMGFLLLGELCLNEAKISLNSALKNGVEIHRQNYLINLFLRKHCRGSKIVVSSRKNMIIHEDSEEIILPPFPGLKLQAIKSSADSNDLLDSLLRTWHPQTLSIVSSPSSNFHKMLHEINRQEDPSCCRYNASSNKCWRHFLKDAKIVNVAEDEDTPSTWLGLKCSNMKDQITSVRLYW